MQRTAKHKKDARKRSQRNSDIITTHVATFCKKRRQNNARRTQDRETKGANMVGIKVITRHREALKTLSVQRPHRQV